MRSIFTLRFLRRCLAISVVTVVALLCGVGGASAQATRADASATDTGWLKVETLELGKRLHVNTKAHAHIDCLFGKADAETLTCGGVVFQKEQIQSIKPSHRVRSTFVGLGVGYGAALAVGLSAAAAGDRCGLGCAAFVVLVDVALLVATPILFHVYDLTSTAIYKAP